MARVDIRQEAAQLTGAAKKLLAVTLLCSYITALPNRNVDHDLSFRLPLFYVRRKKDREMTTACMLFAEYADRMDNPLSPIRRSMRILALIGALLLLAALSGKAQVDPGIPDTLRIDSSIAYTDEPGILPLRMTFDQALSAVEITIRFDSRDIVFDSASFVGTLLEGATFQGYQKISDSAFTIFATWGNPLLQPTSGTVTYAYFSYAPSIAPQVVTFDTFTVILPSSIRRSTEFQDTTTIDQPFVPQFRMGYLDIQTPPASRDSLWIVGGAAQPDEHIAVDVNFFNEENLKDVTVVLTYGSSYLEYDSVTFSGTRGAAAPQKQITPNSSVHKIALALTFGDALPLTPGIGTLARIHFTVAALAPETTLTIDTTTLSALTTIVSLTTVAGGTQFVPFYSSDTVRILAPTAVGDDPDPFALPNEFALSQNYPNPFNPTTTIEFSLPKAAYVRLDIYNILGQQVTRLIDGDLPAGEHRVEFDGNNMATGVYFYRLVTHDYHATKKMLLVK
jgi:hypothetical protein